MDKSSAINLRKDVKAFLKKHKMGYEDGARHFEFSTRQSFWSWIKNDGSSRWTPTCKKVESTLLNGEPITRTPAQKLRGLITEMSAVVEDLESNEDSEEQDNTDEDLE